MRVTIEIDEALAKRLRDRATSHGDDLSAGVIEIFRSALGEESFAMVTFGEGGLNPALNSQIQKSSAVLEEAEAVGTLR